MANEARWQDRALAAYRVVGQDWPRNEAKVGSEGHQLGVWLQAQRNSHRCGKLRLEVEQCLQISPRLEHGANKTEHEAEYTAAEPRLPSDAPVRCRAVVAKGLRFCHRVTGNVRSSISWISDCQFMSPLVYEDACVPWISTAGSDPLNRV